MVIVIQFVSFLRSLQRRVDALWKIMNILKSLILVLLRWVLKILQASRNFVEIETGPFLTASRYFSPVAVKFEHTEAV